MTTATSEKAKLTHKTLYLAGPMRGYPDFNFRAFDATATILRSLGYEVISPADLDRSVGFDPLKDKAAVWNEAPEVTFFRDLNAILTVDAIVTMEGSQYSTGAQLEIAWARALGKPILDVNALVGLHFCDESP